MTREELLEYLETAWGEELAQVGLRCLDTPESLLYVISDALRMGATLEDVRQHADAGIHVLLRDRRDALGLPAAPEPVAEEDEELNNVSE